MAFKTKIKMGRDLSEIEQAERATLLNKLVADGVTDGNNVFEFSTNISTRTFTTREAAEQWVAYVNTNNPAPRSATIVEE